MSFVLIPNISFLFPIKCRLTLPDPDLKQCWKLYSRRFIFQAESLERYSTFLHTSVEKPPEQHTITEHWVDIRFTALVSYVGENQVISTQSSPGILNLIIVEEW